MARIAAGTLVALAMIAGAGGRAAQAGRSLFGWSYGTEVNPVRMVELETWISEENKRGDAKTDKTLIWWGPTIGLTDHLELAIPIEFSAEGVNGGGIDTELIRWGGELRYRFDSPDPVEAGDFTLLARVAMKRAVTERAGFRAEADLIAGYEHGRIAAVVDAATIIEHVPGETLRELDPGVGVSYRAVGDLRFGVEAYAEFPLDEDNLDWLVIGPQASLTHGRFWVTTTYAIGVFGIRTAPRVKFGISF